MYITVKLRIGQACFIDWLAYFMQMSLPWGGTQRRPWIGFSSFRCYSITKILKKSDVIIRDPSPPATSNTWSVWIAQHAIMSWRQDNGVKVKARRVLSHNWRILGINRRRLSMLPERVNTANGNYNRLFKCSIRSICTKQCYQKFTHIINLWNLTMGDWGSKIRIHVQYA